MQHSGRLVKCLQHMSYCVVSHRMLPGLHDANKLYMLNAGMQSCVALQRSSTVGSYCKGGA